MKIYYGICGEGLGHSGRSLALIERLSALGHSVTIFSFADAFQLLAQAGYHPKRIEGLRFRINHRGGVAPIGTACNFVRYLQDRRESLDMIRQLALDERPDLFVTDFEPLTSIAAVSLRIPCISVDNQHRFCHPLGRGFPLRLRSYARLAGAFVRRWIKDPLLSIVAVFHHCPPSRYYKRVEPLQRAQIADKKPTTGDHIILYGRGALGRQMARAAADVSEQFIAYGIDDIAAPNVRCKQPSYDEFTADLAACKAVVSAAGQQLIGEARFYGKPQLVVPIPRQHEQEINARFVRNERLGDFCPIEQLTAQRIGDFLRQEFSRPRAANGLDQALELMRIGNG